MRSLAAARLLCLGHRRARFGVTSAPIRPSCRDARRFPNSGTA